MQLVCSSLFHMHSTVVDIRQKLGNPPPVTPIQPCSCACKLYTSLVAAERKTWPNAHSTHPITSHVLILIHALTLTNCGPRSQVKQKGGTLEQITIADMVFDVLKMAWGRFESTEGSNKPAAGGAVRFA